MQEGEGERVVIYTFSASLLARDSLEASFISYFALAQFSHALYDQCMSTIRSPEGLHAQRVRKEKEEQLVTCETLLQEQKNQAGNSALPSRKGRASHLQRHIRRLRVETQLYKEEANRLEADRKSNLQTACQNYIR